MLYKLSRIDLRYLDLFFLVRNEYTCYMWQVLAVTYMIDRNPCLHGFEFLLGVQFVEVAVRHENGSLSTAIVLVGLVAKKTIINLVEFIYMYSHHEVSKSNS